MKSSQSKQKSLPKSLPKEILGNHEDPVLTTVHQFSKWMDRDLEILLKEKPDWQTISGNLHFFGRQPQEDAL